MSRSLCEIIAAFLAAPEEHGGEVRARLPEILGHAQECEACGALLAESKETERIYAALAGPEAAEQEARHEEMLRSDLDSENRLRAAIEGVLIPGLSELPRVVAREYLAGGGDPLDLYAATEGVSLLLRRRFGRGRGAGFLELHEDLSATSGAEVGTAADEAVNAVARFADLWAGEGEALEPSKDAHRLARWVYLACLDQGDLLRHFRVNRLGRSPDRQRGVPRGPLPLFALEAGERLDDPIARWSPRVQLDRHLLAEPVGEGRFLLAAVPVGAGGEGEWPEGSMLLAASDQVFSALGKPLPVFERKPLVLGMFALRFGRGLVTLDRGGGDTVELPAVRLGVVPPVVEERETEGSSSGFLSA